MYLRRLAFVSGLLLAACAGGTATPLTSAQTVYSWQLKYEAGVDQVTVYASQPLCTDAIVIACHDAKALATAVDVLEEVDGALDAAELVVRNPTCEINPTDPVCDPAAMGASIAPYIATARVGLARITNELLVKEAGK